MPAMRFACGIDTAAKPIWKWENGDEGTPNSGGENPPRDFRAAEALPELAP
jgi:hypothetical protein